MKKYLLAGLLVWLPLAVTVWVLHAVLGMLDGVFAWVLTGGQSLLPASVFSSLEELKGIPGLGVIVMVVCLFVTGVFATNIFGQWWLAQGSRVLQKIPIVKSIYSSVKQVSDTLFSSTGNAFRQAVLVEYPRRGCWTIAFVTGQPSGEAGRFLQHQQEDFVSLYVPTTPNPTSGYFVMVPRTEVIELSMSVDAALKYVISMGVVAPDSVPLPATAPTVLQRLG